MGEKPQIERRALKQEVPLESRGYLTQEPSSFRLTVNSYLSTGWKLSVLTLESYARGPQESSLFCSTVSCSKSCSGRNLKVKYWRVTAIDERRYREFNGDRESCLRKGIQAYVLDRGWKRRIGRYGIESYKLYFDCSKILEGIGGKPEKRLVLVAGRRYS